MSAEITSSEVDWILDGGVPWLRFPPVLEAQFEHDTGQGRSRVLLFHTLLALLLFNLFLGLDYFLVGDVMELAIALRLGVVGGLMAIASWLLSKNLSPIIREGLVVAMTVAAAASVAVLIVSSESPYRGDYHYGLLVIVMFAVMTQRIRFWYAVLACLGCLLVQQVTLHADPVAWQTVLTATSLMVSTIMLSLMSGYVLERDERLGYLRGLRERLRTHRFEELSNLDPLTGLGNRRALEHLLDTLAPSNQPLSIVLIDLDHFKLYNDSFGHQAGDDCLRRVSQLLIGATRDYGDKVFRYGGEEFVAALPGVAAHEAAMVAERMRQAIEDARIRHLKTGRRAPVTVTASLGVASGVLTSDFDKPWLIGRADRCLYKAKASGRNRTVVDTGLSEVA